MIKQYSFKKDGDIILLEVNGVTIKVKELRSHANGVLTTDVILVSTEWIDLMKKLIIALGATKVIITSGYRDSACDKLVGGSGKGMHVNGKAGDCIFYKGKEIIDTKYISCVAQDLGFGGIARISNTAIHLDVRTGTRYLGDETKSTNTVTDDFYKYYKIPRPQSDIDKAIDVLSNKKIIDSPDFWKKNYNTDEGKKYFKDLIIKFANYIK